MRRTYDRPIPSRRAISEGLSRSALCRRTSSAFSAAVRGRPCGRSSLRACAIPAQTRSRRISHSNSANIATIPAIARSVGVVTSNASVVSAGQPNLLAGL
jgi:hypothetical protein